MKKNNNIILFSSGVSEQSGLMSLIISQLEQRGFCCHCWRDLFSNSNDRNAISLLPMLIKKIPTFDFALLICEGHDRTLLLRNGTETEYRTMRDNVLFEIGLCSMALGLDRVILLADEDLHLPEDLYGLHGELAIRRVFLNTGSEADIRRMMDQVEDHILSNQMVYSPVVIGASASTASGYVTNFVFRCMDAVFDGFTDVQTGEWIVPEPGKLDMEIIIPYRFTSRTSLTAQSRQKQMRRGIIPNARRRNLEFSYLREGSRIIIRDYPTTLVTSYSTARTILNLKADDTADPLAEQRFVAKELNLFEAALHALLDRDYLQRYFTHYHSGSPDAELTDHQKRSLRFMQDHIHVIREDY